MSPPIRVAESSFLAHSTDFHTSHAGPSTGDWSSLIGIVTAIIGNVLISFALNLQRYAHVRLEREAHGLGRSSVQRSRESLNGKDAQSRKQRSFAEGLSRRDAQSRSDRGQNGRLHSEAPADARETTALLPKSGESGRSESSTSSGERPDEKKTGDGKRKNYLKSPFWWAGIGLMTVGEAGNFLAYGFAPASIVSPLGVVALISNCLIAPIMLKEPFRKRDVLGVLIAVGGAVTVVLSAKGSNPKLGPHEIWLLISRWEFLTYFGITVASMIILMVASNRYGHKSVMIDIGLVGLFGGYTALATKGVASLLSYRLLRVFTFPVTYLLVAALVGTAVMQIKYVNRALQRFNSTIVIPTQFVFFTIFVVGGSAILYRDFEQTTAAKVGQFVGGVGLTFLGVWCITSGRSEGSDTDDASVDEEQGIDMVDDEQSSDEEADGTAPDSISRRALNGDHAQTPSLRPSTPDGRVGAEPTSPTQESPASFATDSSRLAPPLGRKPRMQATASSPLLPSQKARLPAQAGAPSQSQIASHLASTQRSSSTLQASSGQAPRRPQTPAHAYTDTSPRPALNSSPTLTASSSVPRQTLFMRSSMTGLFNGPYMSPLSGGLSVLVADSRRRDELGVAGSMGRRRTPRSSRSHSQGQVQAQQALLDGAAQQIVGRRQSQGSREMQLPEEVLGGESASGLTGRPRMGGRSTTVEVAGGLHP